MGSVGAGCGDHATARDQVQRVTRSCTAAARASSDVRIRDAGSGKDRNRRKRKAVEVATGKAVVGRRVSPRRRYDSGRPYGQQRRPALRSGRRPADTKADQE